VIQPAKSWRPIQCIFTHCGVVARTLPAMGPKKKERPVGVPAARAWGFGGFSDRSQRDRPGRPMKLKRTIRSHVASEAAILTGLPGNLGWLQPPDDCGLRVPPGLWSGGFIRIGTLVPRQFLGFFHRFFRSFVRARLYFSAMSPLEKVLFSMRMKSRCGKPLGKSGIPSPSRTGTIPR